MIRLDIRIRKITGYDAMPLAEALGYPLHWIKRRWSESVAGYRETVVAEVDGVASGCVSFDHLEEFPDYLHLFGLDVSPALRNRGIGSVLIACVEEQAQERARAGVFLDVSIENHGARRLYERVGYVQDGEPFVNSYFRYDEDGEAEEIVSTLVRMVKRF